MEEQRLRNTFVRLVSELHTHPKGRLPFSCYSVFPINWFKAHDNVYAGYQFWLSYTDQYKELWMYVDGGDLDDPYLELMAFGYYF
jgi:hypothetical protein